MMEKVFKANYSNPESVSIIIFSFLVDNLLDSLEERLRFCPVENVDFN